LCCALSNEHNKRTPKNPESNCPSFFIVGSAPERVPPAEAFYSYKTKFRKHFRRGLPGTDAALRGPTLYAKNPVTPSASFRRAHGTNARLSLLRRRAGFGWSHNLHSIQLRMMCRQSRFFFRSTEQFRMDVSAALDPRLLHFPLNPVRIGPGVMPDARNLPRDFHAGLAAPDLEAVVLHFRRDVQVRPRSPDRGELIAEVLVETLEPIRKRDRGQSVFIQRYHAVVDVHHVGRLDERVIQILVRGI